MAANVAKNAVRVENLREVQREVRRMADAGLKSELKKANRDAASVVASGAQAIVPRKSGTLQGSIKPTNTLNYGAVRAGSAVKVPYAGVIHYGWPARGIEPQPFIMAALAQNTEQVRQQYVQAMEQVARKLNARIG